MIALVQIDLSKIKFEKTDKCNDFCTHPDISTKKIYLGREKRHEGPGVWHTFWFNLTWYGLCASNGIQFVQLSYGVKGGHRCGFEDLYEIVELKEKHGDKRRIDT